MKTFNCLKAAANYAFLEADDEEEISVTIGRTTFSAQAIAWPAMVERIKMNPVPYTPIPLSRKTVRITKRKRLAGLGLGT